jgi:formylglycine-generating enzyme required for sulfatase activity
MQGFISYAHVDLTAFTTLRQQLRALEQAFTTPIELWDDGGLHAGIDWDRTIKPRIEAAELFILLLSPAFLASDYIMRTEVPAIRTRVQAAKGLVCPVILTRCGWQPLVGRLQAVPSLNRKLLPIDEWQPPAHGFDEVRVQIEHALCAHFRLIRQQTDWLTPVLEQRQDPAGLMWGARDDRLVPDPGGGEADMTVTTDPLVRQLYAPNHAKAVDLAALVSRRANTLGTEWDRLAPAVGNLVSILNHPVDRLSDHVASLWECSVRIASLLLQDKRLLARPEAGKAPLEADMHQAMDNLVSSLAPFVRSFPTARLLDDQTGAFLRTSLLFEPARRLVEHAQQTGLVTRDVAEVIRGNLVPAAPDDTQAGKLAEYEIRGVRNLLTSAGLVGARFVAEAAASTDATPSPLVARTSEMLSSGKAEVAHLAATWPDDLKIAYGHLPGALDRAVGDGGGDQATPRDPMSASPREPAGAETSLLDPAFLSVVQMPSWAADRGTDQYGRWVTFEVEAADGAVVTQRMRWIPPGRFTMGSPEHEAGRSDDEGPEHDVTIQAGFWLFDTPCTQALWRAIMGDNPSRFRSPARPVETIDFGQSEEFIRRLNGRLLGLHLALPTEAQWEYACRAGTTLATYAGDLEILGANHAPVLDAIAWFGGNSGHGFELSDGQDSRGWEAKQYAHVRAGTRPVGLKAPNGWGLYDMLGNVWEWCVDLWHDHYDGSPADGCAWMTVSGVHGDAAARVVRGGSWRDRARLLRAACRSRSVPANRSGILGFRCARIQPAGE